MPPGVLLSGKARKKKWCLRPLLKAGRVGVDERWFGSDFQICGATDENDLEVVGVFLIFLPHLTLLTISFFCIDSNLGLVPLTLSYPGISLKLSSRSFTVDINGIKFPPSKLLYGVPQGSVRRSSSATIQLHSVQ